MVNKETARKRIVSYVFLFYWLLIFEGALRKWAFPQYHQIIFFIRDPIVLLIYFTAWRNNFIPKDKLLIVATIISLIYIPLIFIQSVVLKINYLTLIYGWRVYFFYIPLAFIIKESFKLEDIHKFIKQSLIVAIPLSALIYIQYISPRDSFINSGYSEGLAFVVAGTTVRTTGTFSFTAGQTFFASSLMAMLAYAWLYRKQYNLMSMPLLLIATCTSMTHLLLSGSRTAFFMTGLIIVSSFIGLMFTKSTKMKFNGSILIILLILIGAILFIGPFSDSLDKLNQRFENAENSEGSAILRAIAPLIIFLRHVLTAPVLGFGVGFGTGGGSQLATGKASLVLAEDEWSRIILESGPGFGLAFIIYRGVLTSFIFMQSLQSARRDNNILPMIFFGFIGYHLFNGQITHIGTLLGYNWLFVGLIMAATLKNTVSVVQDNKPIIKCPNILSSKRISKKHNKIPSKAITINTVV